MSRNVTKIKTTTTKVDDKTRSGRDRTLITANEQKMKIGAKKKKNTKKIIDTNKESSKKGGTLKKQGKENTQIPLSNEQKMSQYVKRQKIRKNKLKQKVLSEKIIKKQLHLSQ